MHRPMDCRVKPGNDEERKELMPNSLLANLFREFISDDRSATLCFDAPDNRRKNFG